MTTVTESVNGSISVDGIVLIIFSSFPFTEMSLFLVSCCPPPLLLLFWVIRTANGWRSLMTMMMLVSDDRDDDDAMMMFGSHSSCSLSPHLLMSICRLYSGTPSSPTITNSEQF